MKAYRDISMQQTEENKIDIYMLNSH